MIDRTFRAGHGIRNPWLSKISTSLHAPHGSPILSATRIPGDQSLGFAYFQIHHHSDQRLHYRAGLLRRRVFDSKPIPFSTSKLLAPISSKLCSRSRVSSWFLRFAIKSGISLSDRRFRRRRDRCWPEIPNKIPIPSGNQTFEYD